MLSFKPFNSCSVGSMSNHKGIHDQSARDKGNHMTRTRVAIIVFAASAVAAAFPRAAWAECYLENVASPQEIADGWTIHEDLRVVKQVDSAPYEQGGRGNWFVDREKTTLPLCSVFDDLGAYSLRSYMLQPVVTKSRVQICRATADGGSARFVPADAKPKPADTRYEVYEPYNRPYTGSCPPPPPAPARDRRSR